MIGAPGVGKGTYSRMLSKDLGIPELSSGDELRKIVNNQSPLNKKGISIEHIKKTLETGSFMDDQFLYEFMKEKLSDPDYTKGVILDGYPRNINQAKSLDNFLELDLVIKTELREDILIRKLCGRRVCSGCGKNYNICAIHEGDYDMEPLLPKKESNKCDDCSSNLIRREDDIESIIKNRLKLYKIQTSPIEEFYSKRKILKSFEPKKGIKDYPVLLNLVRNSLKLE